MKPIDACMLATISAATVLASAETYVVELAGPDFLYGGLTNMDIELTINAGDTVRWEWTSGFHNVVNGFPGDPDENTIFNSGPPTSDTTTFFEYTFNDEGVFGYHCEVHETTGMVSFITVNAIPAPGTLLALAPAGLMMTRRRRA